LREQTQKQTEQVEQLAQQLNDPFYSLALKYSLPYTPSKTGKK